MTREELQQLIEKIDSKFSPFCGTEVESILVSKDEWDNLKSAINSLLEFNFEAIFPKNVIKQFGHFGPKYQVNDVVSILENGDILMKISFIESGEKANTFLVRF